MNQLMKTLCLLVVAVVLFGATGCKEVVCSFEDDQNIIKDYLSEKGLTAVKTESGLHYIIEEEGKGSLYPNGSSTVKVKYKGYFTDGEVFDQNLDGVSFALSGVIAGWQEGIRLLKKEGKCQLIIPSSLAYGTRAVGGLAGRECSVLIFDVELLDFF